MDPYMDVFTDELTDEEMQALANIVKKSQKIVSIDESGKEEFTANVYGGELVVTEDKSRAMAFDMEIFRNQIHIIFHEMAVVDTIPTCNEDGCEIDYEKILGRKF